jgi:hypothetical protein
MGIRVNAAQAAQLVGRSERRVRQWIADGKLRAEPSGTRTKGEHSGPSAWAIDTDDLERVPGVTVDPTRLAELTAGQNRTPQGLLARVEQLERRLAILERRAQWSLSALSEPSEGRTHPDVAAYVPTTPRPPAAPYSATRPDVSGDDGQLVRLGTFARQHDLSDSTARRWLTREAKEGRTQWAHVETNPSRGDQDVIWLTAEGQTALLAHFAKLHP